MIKIFYAQSFPELKNWKEKLEELVVAHEFIQSDSVKIPRLVENEVSIEGIPAIQDHLSFVEKSVNDWRAPGCGI